LSAKDRFHRAAVRRNRRGCRATPPGTLSRDTSLGANFTGVTYYDGQGFLVEEVAEGEFGAGS